MFWVESPTHLIDFWSLKSLLKLLEIILVSNDFEISYAIFVSVGPLSAHIYFLKAKFDLKTLMYIIMANGNSQPSHLHNIFARDGGLRNFFVG